MARKYLDAAELADDDDPVSATVVVGAAVLAGIAAADAACGAVLGQISRGNDHAQSVELVRSILPAGQVAAQDLSHLLALKDQAHYGFGAISAAQATAALRRARQLVEFAARLS